MQVRLLGICTVTLLVLNCAGFINSPTDLRAATYKWNTANLFIKMRYIVYLIMIEQLPDIHVTLFAL